MSIQSIEGYEVRFVGRPSDPAGTADLLEELYARIECVRGRTYARWAHARWKELIDEAGVWLAESGGRPIGLLVVRNPSSGKGEMSLLFARESEAAPRLVEAAFGAFRAQGMELVTTAFQGWSHPLGGHVPSADQVLDRLGFGSFEVKVLETDPGLASRRPPPPVALPFRIRPLGAPDLPACAAIMNQSPDLLMEEVRYPTDECEGILRRTAGAEGRFAADLAGVAVLPDGAIAGFATAGTNGVIGQVYVLAPYRRRGLGRVLVDRALRALAKRGVERAILTVVAGNDAALSLYRAMGFVDSYSYPLRYWKSVP